MNKNVLPRPERSGEPGPSEPQHRFPPQRHKDTKGPRRSQSLGAFVSLWFNKTLRFPGSRLAGLVLSRTAPAALLLALATAPAAAQDVVWQDLEPGLELAEIDPAGEGFGEGRLTLLRIDPERFDFRLIAASEHGGEARRASEWAAQFSFAAAINAGMYQEDGLSSVGFMVNFGHVNNPHLNPNNAVLAFNPKDPSLPAVRLIDRKCHDFDALKTQYHTLIQSIRMISCEGKNVWEQQPRAWTIAALATDAAGNILFTLSRRPYTVHDYIELLLSLGLDLRGAMYLEGGDKATLYLDSRGRSFERTGGTGTDGGVEGNPAASPIPNVLGVVRRPEG